MSPTSPSRARTSLASGVYAALATPRRPQTIEADTGSLLEYLCTIEQAGVDGLVLFGATGEFVHFDTEQRRCVCSLALKRSRVPVLVNVSHSTLEGALDLAESARSLGAAGLMLMPPYFFRYDEDQIFAFYSAFFDTFGQQTPVYLYNLPFFTNPLTAQGLRRLLVEFPFAGAKDSSGNWDVFTAFLIARDARPFQLMSGHERIYVRALEAGAAGIISGVAAGLPELMVRLERAIRENDQAHVAQFDARVQELLVWMDRFPATVGIRQLAVFRGWAQGASGSLGTTAVPTDPALLASYREWLAGWLPATLEECAK
jgi:dihydrodipicolinate synthase/N-acetylneuraminate lyase